MLDLPDMAARQRANCHASFKAQEYGSSTDYMLFVESSMPHAYRNQPPDQETGTLYGNVPDDL